MLDPKNDSDTEYNIYLGDKVKKLAWFRFATKNFEWATHIVSMDMDTYPFTDTVLADISDPWHSIVADNKTMPEGWSEAKNGMYYGAGCGGKKGMRQGALIGLSRSFLSCMFQNPQLNKSFDVALGAPGGDHTLRYWVAIASKSEVTEYPPQGTCPDPWFVGPPSCEYRDGWQHPLGH